MLLCASVFLHKVSHRFFVKVDVHIADYRDVDVEAGRDGGSQTKHRRPEMLYPQFFGKFTTCFWQRRHDPVSCSVPSHHWTVFLIAHGIFKIPWDFQKPMEFKKKNLGEVRVIFQLFARNAKTFCCGLVIQTTTRMEVTVVHL